MLKLQIVITSTRERRVGGAVGAWFTERARHFGRFDVGVSDLLELALPLLDEPNHPNKRQYEHEHTKRWSAIVEAADAYVFVVPEYNYGMPPALLNALDYLYHEWSYKPAAFVSYGGASGGMRSVQMAKPIITSLKMMPIPEGVAMPFVFKQMVDGKFEPGGAYDQPIEKMLDELLRWAPALATMRAR
jgi:NAD(P)H-dependent FMN reductase